VHPFPSRLYVLPSCTLHRLKRAETQDLAARLVTMDPWRTLEYRADALAAHLSRPDSSFHRLTVRSSGHPAGLLALRYPWLRGVYLELLALFPPYQGLGLGREIMAWILSGQIEVIVVIKSSRRLQPAPGHGKPCLYKKFLV
jgi:GNAT superfamily N-acetyltransferase